ncbi:MAG TPA: NAD(P)H-dependent oxidoreductase [Tissierellaceae bacterium]|nr:NAD(P)H-dependent oxidoreductase [Tissierellaceae bacterium]
MKHLIIYSNPEEESFSHEIKEYVKRFSKENRNEVIIRDLYKLGFDPVLSKEEVRLQDEEKVVDEIKREQEYIDWADFITFIYPVWWMIPAMVKGYFDRVLSYGYAYRFEDGKPKALLNKKALRYNPMGTPRNIYEKNGLRKAYEKVIDSGILQSSGIEVVDSILFGGNPREDKDLQEKYFDELDNSLRKNLLI